MDWLERCPAPRLFPLFETAEPAGEALEREDPEAIEVGVLVLTASKEV
jgi:hypothetical protein